MLTLLEAAEQIRTRRISPVELTRECLQRIERLDPVLNCFITVTADLALEAARRAEAEIAAGNYRGPLHGIPLGLKDLIDTAGVRTTAASNQYRDRVPLHDAAVVSRLKEAGAIILGKLNLHEFAFGISGVVSAFGPARNPWDTTRITGGSSSGSAAAVAAGLCVAALGSDTAGSNRCPPALCGVVGHRPSEGLISLKGVVPLAISFDTVGPVTRTVRDTAAMMDVLTGRPHDFAALNKPIKVGIARKYFFDDLDSGVASCIEQALQTIAALVSGMCEVVVPVDAFRTIFDAEIYAYHAEMLATTPELYDPRTLYRVEKSAGIPAADCMRERTRLQQFRENAQSVFDEVDVVVTPTVPIPAPKLSELEALDAAALRVFEVKYVLRNAAPFSSLYWPSISVPCGFTSGGLPVGLQISARPGDDVAVFRLADAYQQATEWHTRRPPLD